MVRRSELPGEVIEMYSPIGLLPVDAFTGGSPIGSVSAFLDAQDAAGVWRKTGVREVRTPSGVIAYPSLARSAEVPGQPTRYRVRIEAQYYQPLYLKDSDAIEFDAFPYNDSNPPEDYPKKPEDFPDYLNKFLMKVMLTPAPNYPFPNHIFVLRGAVVDKETAEPVVRAEVFWGNKENTLTTGPPDELYDRKRVLTVTKGVFALPLRITEKEQLGNKQTIDAFDHRTEREGEIQISIPQDLGRNQIIPIEK
ncbi:MAG TPA: hypothetical protein VE262_12040 [Blastocatellia bacterium]|nr:hypothetical protein [Blastocatellia bacterium]